MHNDSRIMPIEVDHFDDRTNFRTAYRRLHDRIKALGLLTTEYLVRCAAEEPEENSEEEDDDDQEYVSFMAAPAEQARIGRLYEAWREYFITNIESMREIHQRAPPNEVDVHTGRARKIRNTLGTYVFTEVSRLHYLLARPRALVWEFPEERLSLASLTDPLWVEIGRSFDISDQYEEKEDRDDEVEEGLVKMRALWQSPIAEYRQSEVVLVTLFLTQQLNDVRAACVAEYRGVFEAVWLRATELASETWPDTVLDEPSMRVCVQEQKGGGDAVGLWICSRDYDAFCAFYLGEVMRRLFYWSLLSKRPMADRPPPAMVARVRTWVQETVVGGFAEEAFSDLYAANTEDGYNFAGDSHWYRYMWPNKIHSRAACLAQMRPHLYRRVSTMEGGEGMGGR